MKQLTCMVVDDDISARELLGSLLRTQFGALVVTASDSTEALRKCREKPADIIWLDIDMPDSDGFETLGMILRVKADQYVVMVSGHSSVDYVKKSVELGAKGFIVKPFSTAKVESAVNKFLAAR